MEIGMCLTLILTLVVVVKGARLSRSIGDFDVLNYDTNYVHRQHKRAVSSPYLHRVELNFDAFGRNFQLHLKPDDSVFTNNMVLVTADGTYPKHYLDEIHFYKGQIADIPESFVHGSIKDGLFQGRIHSKNERYSIEPAHRYVNDTTKFHSVIYNDKDVEFPEHPSGNCGITEEIQKKMTEKLMASTDPSSDMEDNHRQKRQNQIDKQTCALHIITDHVFFARYMDSNEILRQMGEHVQAATEVFSGHDFSPYSNINFAIERITLYNNDDIGSISYPFDGDYIGAEKYLDIASSIADNQRYCLVFAFTNRDFANGVLGLAWIPNAANRAGGVCADSFNAGIVTTNNYGENVSPVVSHLTFAHELGHSFGSRHDPDGSRECTPGGEDGNYLMFAHASAGDLPNNNEFSSCSVTNITRVLNSIGTIRNNCFDVLEDIQLCGNLVIEPGEQCDCGLGDNTCEDSCCTQECTLVGNMDCSPQQGLCCTNDCSFSGTGIVCANQTECSEAVNCPGNNALCPEPMPRNNGMPCDEGRRVCNNGACDKSICTLLGREPCQCTEADNYCVICCVNEGGGCTPFNVLNGSREVKFMDTGSPCNAFMGYCDVFSECRLAQEDGPLAGIIRSIFPSEETQLFDAVVSWLRSNWWIALLGVLFTIGLMALIMFLCNLFTPTDNPWKEEVQSAKRNRVNLRNRRNRGSQYPTSQPRDDDKITAF